MLDPYYLQQLTIGISLGMVYALMAIGFTLIFGVLNVVNFAHGEVYTIGAFAGIMAIAAFGPPFLIVVFIVLAAGAIAGFGLERLAFRPFRRFSDEASLKSRAMREATLRRLDREGKLGLQRRRILGLPDTGTGGDE